VVWTRPQTVVPAFKALLKYEPVPLQKMLQQVDEYSSLLINISRWVRYAFVPSWVLPSYRSVFGVLGRKIEETMLATAIHHAQALGIENVYARYIPTSKNKPCLDFFKSLAPRFQQQGGYFVRDRKLPFPVPEYIELDPAP
jgi:hypothetical protein